jgi:hypothetical protein
MLHMHAPAQNGPGVVTNAALYGFVTVIVTIDVVYGVHPGC